MSRLSETELDGVEFNLAHVDDEPPPWVTEPPTPASVERQRVSLEGTRVAILAELERHAPAKAKTKRTA
jgi:hypothetical protein